MKKSDMITELCKSLGRHGFQNLEGISINSSKKDIQTAIDCLNATDEDMDRIGQQFETIYPNIFSKIKHDFKTHTFNRLYVYQTVKTYTTNI